MIKFLQELKDPLLKRAMREDREKYKEEFNAPLEEALEECIPAGLVKDAKTKTGKNKLQDIENLIHLFDQKGANDIMKRVKKIIGK